jgi:bacterial/archaeal transporter family protein
MAVAHDWLTWALLSAVFAALTAIFAKLGLAGIDADFATLVRTWVILAALTGFVWGAGKWHNPFRLQGKTRLFLVLSGLATGASWVCYFRALQVGDASRAGGQAQPPAGGGLRHPFLHERPTPREWTGILLVGAAVLVLGLKR